MKWTDEMAESMLSLIADGKSFEQTARALNRTYGLKLTRNAVAGKMRRFRMNNYPSDTIVKYVQYGDRRVKLELPNFGGDE